MGQLTQWPIGRLQKEHGLDYFVETGLWRGAGLRHALQFPFRHCYSIEASAEFIAGFKPQHATHGRRYTLVHGDSSEELAGLLEFIPGPAFFWLDAHYPHRYMGDDVRDLPLLAEVRAIVESSRGHSGDVILADDTRIYGQATAAGPLPGGLGLRHGSPEELQEILRLLEPTHTVQLDRREGGYLLAVPRVDKGVQQG